MATVRQARHCRATPAVSGQARLTVPRPASAALRREGDTPPGGVAHGMTRSTSSCARGRSKRKNGQALGCCGLPDGERGGVRVPQQPARTAITPMPRWRSTCSARLPRSIPGFGRAPCSARSGLRGAKRGHQGVDFRRRAADRQAAHAGAPAPEPRRQLGLEQGGWKDPSRTWMARRLGLAERPPFGWRPSRRSAAVVGEDDHDTARPAEGGPRLGPQPLGTISRGLSVEEHLVAGGAQVHHRPPGWRASQRDESTSSMLATVTTACQRWSTSMRSAASMPRRQTLEAPCRAWALSLRPGTLELGSSGSTPRMGSMAQDQHPAPRAWRSARRRLRRAR
jgi:hypothetical protein